MPFTAETLRAMRNEALNQAKRFNKDSERLTGTAEFYFPHTLANLFIGLSEILSVGINEAEPK